MESEDFMTDRLRILGTVATREEELNDRLGGDFLFPFWSNLARGTEKKLTSAAGGFPRPCAVAWNRCACSGSALVEKERSGYMPQGCAEITGTRARWQASLRRALNALWLKGAQSRPGKTSADPAKLIPPPAAAARLLALSRKANHPPSESDNSPVKRGRPIIRRKRTVSAGGAEWVGASGSRYNRSGRSIKGER